LTSASFGASSAKSTIRRHSSDIGFSSTKRLGWIAQCTGPVELACATVCAVTEDENDDEDEEGAGEAKGVPAMLAVDSTGDVSESYDDGVCGGGDEN
jgi:hypothetical protein